MSRSVLALLFLAPSAVLAGCFSFVEPPLSSGCTRAQTELMWLNPVRLMERVNLPRLPYDPRLYDAALSQGLAVTGDLRFDLRVDGPQLVEIFLAVEDGESHSFALESGGKVIDSRYAAVSEASGLRGVCLLGVLNGAFSVRSSAARYVISAVRWTPQTQFEAELAPAWLDRARQLAADPFLEDLHSRRRDNLEQLYARIALSSRPEIRKEAILGQARMAYWLAAKSQLPGDVARADSLLREAFKLSPEDKILREVVSSSCADRNVKSGHLAYGAYCTEAVPVLWTVALTPDPPNAPEWAVMQRRLAARLGAITKWWVERRQRPDGQIGGGWREDVGMLREWAPQALGLGAPVAAVGLRKLAEGLWASGLLAKGDDRTLEDALPLMAALAPEDESVIAKLRQAAERAEGPALWYAYLTGDRSVKPSGPDPARPGSSDTPDSTPFDAAWNMVSLAKQGESALARDFDMYTSEVIFTDRVYYPLGPQYARYLFGGDVPRGDRCPTFAVTWPPAETEFARAVLEATSASLRMRLYSFEARPATAQVRVWKLAPGRYRWTSTDIIGTELAKGDVVIARRTQTLSFPLPPAKEIDLSIRRVEP